MSKNNYRDQPACMNCKFRVTKEDSAHCYCNLDDSYRTYLSLDLYDDYEIEEMWKWNDEHDVNCAGICDKYQIG